MGKKHSNELNVKVVDYPNMVYVGAEGNERGYMADGDAKAKGLKINKLSGTEFRKRLRSGEEIPEWFAFPKVVKVLRDGGDKIFLVQNLAIPVETKRLPILAINGVEIGGSTVDEDVLSSSWSVNHGEVCGARLRSVLHSVEGLSRLLFSTLMLCWNIRRVLPDEVEENARRLSFQEWTEINAKIEADGTTPSIAVQKCIYNALLQDECLELLPEQRQVVDLEGLKAEMFEAPGPKGHRHLSGSFEAEDVTSLLGWASIPTGGLERYELMPNGGHPGGGFTGAKLSHCILSETSSSFMGAPPVHQELSSKDTGEAVWMCLKHKAWLFLSTAPSDAAPYAFIRLQDSVLRETNFAECSVVLAGRKRLGEDAGGPFGDGGRLPLQLCFLLADGRFQLFEAVWLQLQFPNDEDLQHWSVALADACASDVTPQLPNGDGWI
eukprot:symbB.v1.2.029505.t1/scaffold3237.1/size60492/3